MNGLVPRTRGEWQAVQIYADELVAVIDMVDRLGDYDVPIDHAVEQHDWATADRLYADVSNWVQEMAERMENIHTPPPMLLPHGIAHQALRNKDLHEYDAANVLLSHVGTMFAHLGQVLGDLAETYPALPDA